LENQNEVLATKAGFVNSTKVVRVIYNGNEISNEDLMRFAETNKMTPVSNQGQFVWAEADEDYFIQHSKHKYLALTEIQKAKINSALGLKKLLGDSLVQSSKFCPTSWANQKTGYRTT
jgi:hypothetical protein